jgi:TatD DNase family protein
MDIPYIDLHTHRCGPESGVEKVCACRLGIGEPPPPGRFTAGVHPWDVAKTDLSVLGFFSDPPPRGLVGIGEIGLDFAVRDADRPLQTMWLDEQLSIAEYFNFPVILHAVKAYNEIQVELKKHRLKTVVFHGFTGSPELARQLTGLGYALSFSALSLRSPRTVEALKIVPAECLFLETDDDPAAGIGRLYGEAAVLRGTRLDVLKEIIYNNYRKWGFVIRN